jgi:hypothetical protein
VMARLPVNLMHGQTTYAVAISGAARALYLITNWKLEAIDLQKLWEHGPSAVPPPPGRDEEQELAVGCGEVPSPPTNAFPALGAVFCPRIISHVRGRGFESPHLHQRKPITL